MGNKKQKPIVQNEKFISLMQLAREEPDVRKRVKAILSLDSFNRRSLLNTWLRDMRLQGAPADYVEALSYFLDDEVAEKALEILLEDEALSK